MYEIWLGMNIMYEIALQHLPLLAIFIALLVLTYGIAWKKTDKQAWKRTFKPLILIGVVLFIALFIVIPFATKSSLAELGYWLDAIFLASIALGFTGAIMLLLWPIMSLNAKKQAL